MPGAFQLGGPSLGGQEAAHGHRGETCPLPRPASQGIGGRSQREAGPQLRLQGLAQGSQASVTPFLLAPVGIGNRKKQAGTGVQQLRPERPAPPTPRAFLICFLEGGTCWGVGGEQAGPSPGLKTGLCATELEIRGRAPSF